MNAIKAESPSTATERQPSNLRVAVISEPGKAGVKTHVVDLLRRIDTKKFDIVYYYSSCRSDSAYASEIQDLIRRGISCHEISMKDRIQPIRDGCSLLQIIWLLLRQRPHILHLHSSKAGGLGRLASLFLFPRPKVFYTPHAMACYRSRIYLWMERILGRLTDVLVAVSASERDDFIRWRIPNSEHAVTVTLGVHPPHLNSTPTVSGKCNLETWTVGACGRICFQKNALLFFRAALELHKRDQSYRFCWIGDFSEDREAQSVKELLREAAWPEEIQITGWQSSPQQYLIQLDTFCMFSRYESFGYVTADAMMLGIPVVGTRATGTVDLVRDGITGLLTEPNIDSVTAAWERLKNDKDLRTRLSSNARVFVTETHSVSKMVAQIERLYLQSQDDPNAPSH